MELALVLDGLLKAKYGTLREVDKLVKDTTIARAELFRRLGDDVRRAEDGKLPSNLEPALAVAARESNWEELIPWGSFRSVIKTYRAEQSKRAV